MALLAPAPAPGNKGGIQLEYEYTLCGRMSPCPGNEGPPAAPRVDHQWRMVATQGPDSDMQQKKASSLQKKNSLRLFLTTRRVPAQLSAVQNVRFLMLMIHWIALHCSPASTVDALKLHKGRASPLLSLSLLLSPFGPKARMAATWFPQSHLAAPLPSPPFPPT